MLRQGERERVDRSESPERIDTFWHGGKILPRAPVVAREYPEKLDSIRGWGRREVAICRLV